MLWGKSTTFTLWGWIFRRLGGLIVDAHLGRDVDEGEGSCTAISGWMSTLVGLSLFDLAIKLNVSSCLGVTPLVTFCLPGSESLVFPIILLLGDRV